MTSPAYRNSTTAGQATGTNLAITKPTGTVDGDILVAQISKDDTTAITPPAGWTTITTKSQTGHMSGWYYKRAASEGASWQWNFANQWRTGYVVAISGAVASGSPLDPDPPAAAVGSNAATTVSPGPNTTLTIDTLVLLLIGAGGATTWSNSSGMTQRIGVDEVYFADIAQAATGSTGTKTGGPGSSQAIEGLLIEIASTTAGAAAASLVMPHNPLAAMLGR